MKPRVGPECPKCKETFTEELSKTAKTTLFGCNNCGHTFRVNNVNDPKAVKR